MSVWTARSASVNNNWNSVVYGKDLSGNGLFVAVAYSGTDNRVMTSYNGINWTTRTSAANNNWLGVTYGLDSSGNGLFVAVAGSGTGNRVMTSNDGINWTIRTSAADNNWNSVTYGLDSSGNGLFVAVAITGTGNRVMTSPNGINWTSRTAAANNNWYSITYGNGLFVAVANSGTGNRVMTSSNGITWTIRTSAADNGWTSITYGNGLFVAVAMTGTGNRVMTSPDGITWTIRTSAANNNWYSITYGNGLFVAVAITGTGNRIMTSSDGINWALRTSPADNSWTSVTYGLDSLGNKLFIAVADSGTNRVMTCFSPTITNFTIPNKLITDSSFTITDPSSNSSGAFTYSSLTPSVATVSGKNVTIISLGSATIKAIQSEAINYASASIYTSFNVANANPTITNFTIPNKTYGDIPFTITAPTSNSSGSFSYTSLNPRVATVSSNTVTIVGTGNVTIRATQDASGNYTSGSIDTSFNVANANPTITNFTIPNKTYSVVPFTITAPTSNSSGSFSYTSLNPRVATVSGNTVTIVRLGNATIIATQDASGNYNSGSIDTSFNVTVGNIPICFPAGTPVETDQGKISIEKIDNNINTIKGKKIVAITKTVTTEDTVICIEKGALDSNIPSQKTFISRNHKLLYNKKMIKAKELIGKVEGIYNKKYNGEILYNVLLETHENIIINNLIVETLDPTNFVAKLYNGSRTEETVNSIIETINQSANYKKTYSKMH